MQPLYTENDFKLAKYKQKLKLKCINCSKVFYRTKHFINVAICGQKRGRKYAADFCSIKCHNLFINPPSEVICKKCGKLFTKNKSSIRKTKNNFCCRSCAAIWNNSHRETGTRVSKLEKWIAQNLESKYSFLKFRFNKSDTINSEIDIFIPKLKIAFEINGIHHYKPIYGEKKLEKIRKNDLKKIEACIKIGIKLFVINISDQKVFKPESSSKYLEEIQNIIDQTLEHSSI